MGHGHEQGDEELLFTVGSVWREMRVSCPHPDVLRAFAAGSLGEGALDFLRFHLEESQCPYCHATLEDMRVGEAEAGRQELEDLEKRLLRSTVAALRRAAGS